MSERDSWNDPQPQSEVPPLPKKKGMSGCMLASLIAGGVSVVGLLVCCGVFGWFMAMFMPKMTAEPAEVAEVAKKIIDTEMLPDFSPDKAITIDNMIMSMRIAEFKHKEGKGELMMGNVVVKMGDANQAQMQSTQFRSQFEERMRESVDIKKSESQQITINGQKANVVIGEGTDRNSGKAVHTATTDFEAGTSITFLRLRMDDEIWDQDAVLKMLEGATAAAADPKSEEPKADAVKPDDAAAEEPKADEPKIEPAKPE